MDKKLVFRLFFPLWLEALSKNLISFLNIFILNKYSPGAAAGISVCGQLTYLISIIYTIVTIGTIIILSQTLGADDKNKADKIVYNAFLFNIIAGIILSIILFCFSKVILQSMGISNEIMEYSNVYLRISGLFSFLTSFFVTCSAVINCYKYTFVTMFSSFLKNILNVILVFISVQNFEKNVILGIAISSVVSQLFGCILLSIFINKRIGIKIFSVWKNKFDIDIFKQIYKLGIPSAIEVLLGHLSSVYIISIISSMGTEYLIARTYVYNLMLFVMPFGTCFGQTGQIIIGRYYGAKKRNEANRTFIFVLIISILCALSSSIILYIFKDFFVKLYTSDSNIISIAKPVFKIIILLECGRCINSVGVNALKVIGDVKFPVIMGIITMWGIGVMLSKVLGIYCNLGLLGIWIAYSMDEWIRGIFILLKWKKKRMVILNK